MTKNTRTRILLVAVASLLLVTMAVGGTMAWLHTNTEPVVNTFTPSSVNVGLTETTGEEYQMIPGQDIEKDPYVYVEASEKNVPYYAFVKIEETANFADFFEAYSVETDEGWAPVDGVNNVYYILVDDETEALNAQQWYVINDNTLTVKEGVSLEQMSALTEANYPKLTFTAYVIQYAGFDTAEAAWAELNP